MKAATADTRRRSTDSPNSDNATSSWKRPATAALLGLMFCLVGCGRASAGPQPTPPSCKLPVGGPIDGFVSYPSGQYQAAVGVPPGTIPNTYSPTLRKWVPVAPGVLSPDAADRADEDRTTGSLVVEDLRTHQRRTVGSSVGLLLVSWTSLGIYGLDSNGHLLRINPTDGAASIVPAPSGSIQGSSYSAQGVWTLVPIPDSSDRWVDHVDAKNGPAKHWIRVHQSGNSNPSQFMIGFDRDGWPFILTATTGTDVELLDATDHGQTVVWSSASQPDLSPVSGHGDSIGIWLAGQDGSLWLYRQGQLQRFTQPLGIYVVMQDCA